VDAGLDDYVEPLGTRLRIGAGAVG
jgi:hypothetical protein